MTPLTVAHQAPLSSTISWSLLKFIPLSQWCPPTILSSAAVFSFCIQSFPASGSCPVSQLFVSGGQSIGASASASVLLMNIQGWYLLGLTSLISLKSKDSQESSPAPWFESINYSAQLSFLSFSHLNITTGKTITLNIWSLVDKVMSLLFNTLFRFVIAFFQGASISKFHDCSHHL